MKTTIYVFSGTGNSLAVAKQIAAGLEEVQIRSIAKYMKDETVTTHDERVGFVFPCYYGEIPSIVKEFVRKLKMKEARYVFCVITAGASAGYGLSIMNQLLHEQGKKLNYGNSVVMTSNYIVAWYYKLLYRGSEQIQKKLKDVEEKIRLMVKEIQNAREFVAKGSTMGYIMPHIISPSKIVRDTRPFDREFLAGENCNGCGICAKVCPVSNIQMDNRGPMFTHNCQRCMACLMYCPRQAILIKEKKMFNGRYHHPDISALEISAFHQGL